MLTYKQKFDSLINNNILGIDVSYAQGKIDWNSILNYNPWISFCIIKSNQNNYIDSQWYNNWKGIQNTTIVPMIYMMPEFNKPLQLQIDCTKNLLNEFDYKPKAIFIDFEIITTMPTQGVISCLKQIKEEFKNIAPVIIYSYWGFIQPYIQPDDKFLLADYTNINPVHSHPSIGQQFSGWVPCCAANNSCNGMIQGNICKNPNHDHGLILQLSDCNTTAVDVDMLNKDFWNQIT